MQTGHSEVGNLAPHLMMGEGTDLSKMLLAAHDISKVASRLPAACGNGLMMATFRLNPFSGLDTPRHSVRSRVRQFRRAVSQYKR